MAVEWANVGDVFLKALPGFAKGLSQPRFLFGIALLGIVLLFLPDDWAGPFSIKTIRDNYREWIGIATLAVFVFGIVQLIPVAQGRLRERKKRKATLDSLPTLSPEERFLLAHCLSQQQTTLSIDVTDQWAKALVAKGIMETYAGLGRPLSWPFTVRDFVWKHINRNPRLIFQNADLNPPTLQRKFTEYESAYRARLKNLRALG